MWSARIRSLLALRESDDAAPAAMFDDGDDIDASSLEALTQLGETVDLFIPIQ